jgi:hypothetical protein
MINRQHERPSIVSDNAAQAACFAPTCVFKHSIFSLLTLSASHNSISYVQFCQHDFAKS